MSKPKHNRHYITIPDDLWEFAKALGDGNGSKGIRKALKGYNRLRERAKAKPYKEDDNG